MWLANITYFDCACSVSCFQSLVDRDSVTTSTMRKGKEHTFQLFSFFTLFVVKHEPFQMLLLYFVLQLCRTSVHR
jgi:hypothetical protein